MLLIFNLQLTALVFDALDDLTGIQRLLFPLFLSFFLLLPLICLALLSLKPLQLDLLVCHLDHFQFFRTHLQKLLIDPRLHVFGNGRIHPFCSISRQLLLHL